MTGQRHREVVEILHIETEPAVDGETPLAGIVVIIVVVMPVLVLGQSYRSW